MSPTVPDLNRREFIKHTSITSAAVCGGVIQNGVDSKHLAAAERDDAAIPIVDTHQHLWDLSEVRLPWLKNDGVKSIARNFVMSDYKQATKDVNVVKSVYMEVNVHPDDQDKEAEYVTKLCQRQDNAMVAAVIGGSPQNKEFGAYAKKHSKNSYIKGFRTVLHDADRPKGMCLQPTFVDNMKLLGELDLSYDLCMRPDEILDGVKLVDKCPKTRFVVDHCGNLSVQETDKKVRKSWSKGIREMAKRENVVCKISGIIVTAKPDWKPADLEENMTFCMEAFGEDRAYFAGDWPVCTLKASFKQWSDALKWIVRKESVEFKRKLFHDNAVKFYSLS